MRTFSRFALTLLAVVPLARAADAKPIRVGLYKGEGCCVYWHTAAHTAGANIARMLAAPTQVTNLGAAPLVPAAKVLTEKFGLSTGQGTPTEIQRGAFIRALDTLDVVVFINNVNPNSLFPDSAQRARLESFSRTRGMVALHATSENRGEGAIPWGAWDTLLGARFRNHPIADRNATLHLDTVARHQAAWRFLNHGLPDTARFVEEWHSFEETGAQIRAVPGLKVTVNIDETSYTAGMGGAFAMGDHPMSWYREFPQGGRFFFTALGHRAQNYDSLGPTYFLRRQIYNAVLWAAKVDSTGVVSTAPRLAPAAPSFVLRTLRSAIQVEVPARILCRVEVFASDGRRIAARRIDHRADIRVPGPGLYLVLFTLPEGKVSRKVLVP